MRGQRSLDFSMQLSWVPPSPTSYPSLVSQPDVRRFIKDSWWEVQAQLTVAACAVLETVQHPATDVFGDDQQTLTALSVILVRYTPSIRYIVMSIVLTLSGGSLLRSAFEGLFSGYVFPIIGDRVYQTSGHNRSQVCSWALLCNSEKNADFQRKSDNTFSDVSKSCVLKGLITPFIY